MKLRALIWSVVALTALFLVWVIYSARSLINYQSYTASFEANFVEMCSESAPRTKCYCALRYMEEHYTYQEALSMADRGDFGELENGVKNRCL